MTRLLLLVLLVLIVNRLMLMRLLLLLGWRLLVELIAQVRSAIDGIER